MLPYPGTIFPLLNDSTNKSAAFLAGTPKGPDAGPDKKVMTPILNLSLSD